MTFLLDNDPVETKEWIESIKSVIRVSGAERARFLLEQTIREASALRSNVSSSAINTRYINTISDDLPYPGDLSIESIIDGYINWNAAAMVLRANREDSNLGGHIASFQSASSLYSVGFMHFWHGSEPGAIQNSDLIYFQGHLTPGIYSRSFIEGRLTEQHLMNFRQEVCGSGLSSYPHPWLMPDYWQFPTVSMGLGPLMAIYQARFLKYLHAREIANTEHRHVWAMLGDGEIDEPESISALSLAAREKLDNLIFVVNCNLQRLDGPVRGNSKIIQELEGVFRGAGWNVIKLIWSSDWDVLFEHDTTGKLLQLVEEFTDGDYQTLKSRDPSYMRDHFFARYPETASLIQNYTDKDLSRLNYGGHDPKKIYNAYAAAVAHRKQPTVILAKTVKGYGMGSAGEARMTSHQAKKMKEEALRQFRDHLQVPIDDSQIDALPFIRLSQSSPEIQYLQSRRKSLGGCLPRREISCSNSQVAPNLKVFDTLLSDSGDREFSTTMAFVRALSLLMRDKNLTRHIVPILADEGRTFGMESMFKQYGIFNPLGQIYKPQDEGQLSYYREDATGQVLQEGINEAGAMASWIAAGTSYSVSNTPMIPFYIYYSMFGFQRVGDLIWAAGDVRSRGFLIGATSGRTTLNGEGLQHQDGHSHLIATTVPNCVSYDPTYAYEVACIIQHGLTKILNQEDKFFYMTTLNENYAHPSMPQGSEEGIIKGMYLFKNIQNKKPKITLLGCGAILREVEAAAELLASDYGLSVDLWSVTSFTELAREAQDCDRWSMMHPDQPTKTSYVFQCLQGAGPVVAATDYVKLFAEQIRPFITNPYRVLGTDGVGRSDYRQRLRSFFEVDRYYITLASLKLMADCGLIKAQLALDAIAKYKINPDKDNPLFC